MRAMDSRRDFTSKKVFSGYFSELGEKANSALPFVVALCANGSARIDDRRVVHTVLFPDGGWRVFTTAHVRSGRSERRIISSTETTAVPVVTLEEITAFTWYKGM